MNCGVANQGQVVACHSNSQTMGKGMSQKAHDIPAYLCGLCHDELDGRSGSLTRDEKERMFDKACIKSLVWAFQAGHIYASMRAAA